VSEFEVGDLVRLVALLRKNPASAAVRGRARALRLAWKALAEDPTSEPPVLSSESQVPSLEPQVPSSDPQVPSSEPLVQPPVPSVPPLGPEAFPLLARGLGAQVLSSGVRRRAVRLLFAVLLDLGAAAALEVR